MTAFQKNDRLPLPREHGAWAMFFVPLTVGIGAANRSDAATLLFALTAFGFFLLRYPLAVALKSRAPDVRAHAWRWSAIYAALTLVSGTTLLLVTQLALLAGLAVLGFASLAIYLGFAVRRAEMSLAGEWLGIAGLALAAPGAYLVATRALDATAFAIYALNVGYFGGTVSYIKFKVREQLRVVAPNASLTARLWAGRWTLAYHALTLGVVLALAGIGWTPMVLTLAFGLPLCKVVGGLLLRPARLNVPRLGFIELGVTLGFVFIVLLAY